MKIRRAVKADLPAVCRLCRECTRHMDESGIPQWDEIYPNDEVFGEDIAGGTLYVADTEEGIAGCIVLNGEQPAEYRGVCWRYPGKAAVVHRLMVLPEAEGTGVAGRLLAFAESAAAREGFDCVRLDMFTENPRAVAFYDKHGFRRCGTVRFRKGLFYCAEKPPAAGGAAEKHPEPSRCGG